MSNRRPKPDDTSWGTVGGGRREWAVFILSLIPHLMVLGLLIYAITQGG